MTAKEYETIGNVLKLTVEVLQDNMKIFNYNEQVLACMGTLSVLSIHCKQISDDLQEYGPESPTFDSTKWRALLDSGFRSRTFVTQSNREKALKTPVAGERSAAACLAMAMLNDLYYMVPQGLDNSYADVVYYNTDDE